MLQAYQELATILLNYHIGLLFLVRCVLEYRCGWVGVVSVLQAEAQLAILFHFLCAQHLLKQPATRIPLQPNHTETPTHIEPRTIRPMW